MTYARKMAEEAVSSKRMPYVLYPNNVQQKAIDGIEALILEVIERCAREARIPVDQHGAHGLADEVERRVKRLATQEDR